MGFLFLKMQFSKAKIFLFCLIGFISGIGLASYLPTSFLEPRIFLFSISILFLVLLCLFWNRTVKIYKEIPIFILFFFLFFLFLGLWRFSISIVGNTPDKIWFYNNQTVVARGVILNEPDIRDSNTKLTVAVKTIGLDSGELLKVSGKVLATTDLYPEHAFGDEIEMTCKLQAPGEINGFAYDKYLARYDIYSVCYYPKIKLLKSNQGNIFLEYVFKFKVYILSLIERGLGEPEASLGSAILFGVRHGIPAELTQEFSQAGVTHIMAVSGMNITIVAALSLNLLLFLGLSRKQSFYFSLFLIFSFVVLVGLPASAVRAGLMGGLLLWAMRLGRLNKITNALCLAATIMLALNPKLLRYDVGFQLSFLAIFGLVYFYPLINKLLDKCKIPELKGARDILAITVAAQVFTLPIIVYDFGTVSLIAPVANLFILWLITPLTVALFSAMFLTAVLPSFAVLFFFPSLMALKYIIACCDFFPHLPLAYVKIEYINPLWLVLYYFCVVILVVKTRDWVNK
jgi:competence protein ComEC